MSQNIDIVVSAPQSNHQREGVTADPTTDSQSRHSEAELHERGVRGAFLFEGGGTNFMAGDLVAVYHCRQDYPEWTRFHRDPREAWLDLSQEARDQLFALDLGAGDTQLDVPLSDVPNVPGDSMFRPLQISPLGDSVPKKLNLLGEELAGFLWVLREFERQNGKPLKLDREDDGVPRF